MTNCVPKAGLLDVAKRTLAAVWGRTHHRMPPAPAGMPGCGDAAARTQDIEPLPQQQQTMFVDGQPVAVAPGETVICVLNAMGQRSFSRNDHFQASGGYCWMGVCHACLVKVDGGYKRRACQTLAMPGMHVETACNRFGEVGLPQQQT
jgi:hydrogen cyanide synthase HcnA